MALGSKLANELSRLVGTTTPTQVSVSDAAGLRLTVDLTSIDSMSCSASQLELFVPLLQNAAFDALKQWADDLSRRITYLLEQIAPLEYDPAAGQVLIRSSPPDQLADGAQFYEIVLSSQSGGNFLLRRYRSTKGQPGRDPVDLTVTHEVLVKLADDLDATIPTGTP